MAGDLQPLDEKFAIVGPDGRPTLYFIKWCQSRQIDITEALTLLGLEEYLLAHPLQEGSGIQITPSGNLADSPTIAADVQEILDQITTTQGSIIYRNASDWVALAPGASGEFLKTNGAGANPAWAAVVGGGGMALLATASPSGVASVSFTGIPATYKDLRLVVSGRSTDAAASVAVTTRFNNDGGANYDYDVSQLNNVTITNFTGIAQTQAYVGNLVGAGGTANFPGASTVDVLNYAGTTFQKDGLYQSGMKRTNAVGSFFTERGSIWWRNTAAINRVDVLLGAGNFVAGSRVSLYGIG